MYKAIFIDIDGTLKDSKGNINQRTINAIKKVTQKGILVVICTGRPRGYTQDISENCFASKYVISSNGGNIYDYNDITMFKKVGYSVAMGNASKEVKKHASEVTLSNNNDGVAVFLEKLYTFEDEKFSFQNKMDKITI